MMNQKVLLISFFFPISFSLSSISLLLEVICDLFIYILNRYWKEGQLLRAGDRQTKGRPPGRREEENCSRGEEKGGSGSGKEEKSTGWARKVEEEY
jgi:hypothetical protein